MNGHAITIWDRAANDLFADARRSLESEEFEALLDAFCERAARHRSLQLEELRGEEPLRPATRTVGPRAVIEIPLEGNPRLRFEGASRDEVARLGDWIHSHVELVALVDQAYALMVRST